MGKSRRRWGFGWEALVTVMPSLTRLIGRSISGSHGTITRCMPSSSSRATSSNTRRCPASKIEGSLHGGAEFYGAKDLDVVLCHDPLPTRLPVGQLARTYGTSPGLRAADLRPPPAPGNHYTADTRVREYNRLPHDISPDLPAPRSRGESNDLHVEGKLEPKREIDTTTYLVTADVWSVDVNAGIYEVVVFALVDGKTDVVSEYTILWEAKAPGCPGALGRRMQDSPRGMYNRSRPPQRGHDLRLTCRALPGRIGPA